MVIEPAVRRAVGDLSSRPSPQKSFLAIYGPHALSLLRNSSGLKLYSCVP